MPSLVLSLLIAGCSCNDTASAPAVDAAALPVTPPPAPTSPAPITLEQPGGSVVWRGLDHLAEGTYSFPSQTDSVGSDGHFLLNDEWTDGGARKGGIHEYVHVLPFNTGMPRPNYAPLGARIVVGGKDLPFSTTIAAPSARAETTWYVDHGKIKLLSPDNPNAWSPAAEMIVDELGAAIKLRQLASSGLPPADFARTAVTVEGTTRPGLFLPAPAAADFTVSLPAKGKLHFGLAMLDNPLTGKPSGDGVDVTVTLDGASLWSGHVNAENVHQDVVVDLSEAAAPRSGVLRFASEGGAGTAGDYLVVTAPYVTDGGVHAPRHVVVVGIDTLRWDTLSANGYSRSTSPELDAWLAQSVQFTHAYSSAPRTKPSFRTAFTGRYPTGAHDLPTIAEVLAPLGFSTAGVVGNVHLVSRFGFNRGMDYWQYENGAKATDQVDRALAWAGAHQDEDTYLFVHFMDPHTFYEAPEPYKDRFEDGKKRPKAVPGRFNRWQIYNLMQKHRLTDEGKAWIRGAYDEEVAYTSHEVSRLLAGVDALPGQTLEVIHSDHGEEFWDHGQYEHNHTLYNELVHVELAVRPPKGWSGAPSVRDNVGLVDLAATVFDFLGVPMEQRPPTDGVSLRPLIDPAHSAERSTLQDTLHGRPLLVGSLRYGRDRWGTVYQKYKYILQTASGTQELYDLETDPTEQNNLYSTADATSVGLLREALERASGWPVRRGFRVRVPENATLTTIRFVEPISAAVVMDPELNEQIRANQEWGEVPKRTPADIGALTLSDDRKMLTFNPGRASFGGTLLLQCVADPCPAGTLTMGQVKVPFEAGMFTGGTLYAVEPGTIIIPNDASDLPEESGNVSGVERDQLESLGYLHADPEAEEP